MKLDHKWPAKRSKNLEKMIEMASKDEAYLFELVAMFLFDYADIPWKLGDTNASLLLGFLSHRMTSYKQEILHNRAKKRKKKRA